MNVGDTFLVPLRAHGFGAATVIDADGGFTFVVADGFWDAPPSPEVLGDVGEMSLFFGQRPLPGRPGVFKGWFEGEVPSDFEILMSRPLSERQGKLRGAEGTMVFQSARHFARTLSDQWRWLHDRAAYVEEIESRAARAKSVQEQRRANLSLESMLGEEFFASWSDRWPQERLTEARQIFTDATAKLIALEKAGTAAKRKATIQRIVEAFNRLDHQTGLVESVERDQIVQRIDELASVVGLDNAREQLTRRRTW